MATYHSISAMRKLEVQQLAADIGIDSSAYKTRTELLEVCRAALLRRADELKDDPRFIGLYASKRSLMRKASSIAPRTPKRGTDSSSPSSPHPADDPDASHSSNSSSPPFASTSLASNPNVSSYSLPADESILISTNNVIPKGREIARSPIKPLHDATAGGIFGEGEDGIPGSVRKLARSVFGERGVFSGFGGGGSPIGKGKTPQKERKEEEMEGEEEEEEEEDQEDEGERGQDVEQEQAIQHNEQEKQQQYSSPARSTRSRTTRELSLVPHVPSPLSNSVSNAASNAERALAKASHSVQEAGQDISDSLVHTRDQVVEKRDRLVQSVQDGEKRVEEAGENVAGSLRRVWDERIWFPSREILSSPVTQTLLLLGIELLLLASQTLIFHSPSSIHSSPGAREPHHIDLSFPPHTPSTPPSGDEAIHGAYEILHHHVIKNDNKPWLRLSFDAPALGVSELVKGLVFDVVDWETSFWGWDVKERLVWPVGVWALSTILIPSILSLLLSSPRPPSSSSSSSTTSSTPSDPQPQALTTANSPTSPPQPPASSASQRTLIFHIIRSSIWAIVLATTPSSPSSFNNENNLVVSQLRKTGFERMAFVLNVTAVVLGFARQLGGQQQ